MTTTLPPTTTTNELKRARKGRGMPCLPEAKAGGEGGKRSRGAGQKWRLRTRNLVGAIYKIMVGVSICVLVCIWLEYKHECNHNSRNFTRRIPQN